MFPVYVSHPLSASGTPLFFKKKASSPSPQGFPPVPVPLPKIFFSFEFLSGVGFSFDSFFFGRESPCPFLKHFFSFPLFSPILLKRSAVWQGSTPSRQMRWFHNCCFAIAFSFFPFEGGIFPPVTADGLF